VRKATVLPTVRYQDRLSIVASNSSPRSLITPILARGTFFPAAEPAGDSLKGRYGLLGFNLEEGTTLEEAMRIADLMNNKITSLTLTK